MTTIADLITYPVKSCRGIHHDAIEVTRTGLANDRRWMIIDDAGVAVTQREQSRLALVVPTLEEEILSLDAPGMSRFSMPAGTIEQAETVELFGEHISSLSVSLAANEWFSDYLGASVRLVTCDPSFNRRGGVQYPSRDEAPTSFTDNYGILVISEASHNDLNSRMDVSLPMNRFRPNIVVKGVEAYDEDYFQSARTGDVELRFIDLCYRCNLTTIDQEKAVFGQEPLVTLGAYRNEKAGVKFGSYAAVSGGFGLLLKTGSTMEVELSF